MKFKKHKKIIILVGVMIAVLSTVGFGLARNGYFGGGADQGVPDDTWTRGLVASYDFDEGGGQVAYNAAATGQVNDGTLGSSASADSADPKYTSVINNQSSIGPSGTALQFDGKDDYVNCGSDSSLDITDAITIEAWIQPFNFKGGGNVNDGYQMFVGKGDDNAYQLRAYAKTGNVQGFLNIGGVNRLINGNTVLDDYSWYYVSLTFDGSQMNLYINGISDATPLNYAGSINTIADSFWVGKRTDGYFFNGSIDGVKIYNRALSAEEVRYHYNCGGPVAHWKFDEGSGESAQDSSGNNNDGTLKSSALDFDGSDDYVSVAHHASLDFDLGTQDFSIEAWIKRDGGVVGNSAIVDSRDANDDGYRLTFMSDVLYLSVDAIDVVSALSIADTNWHHIVGVIDRDGNGQIYIDGVSNGNAVAINSEAMDTTCNCYIGNQKAGSASFNGAIDEVRIYNAALTSEEVARHYDGDFSQDPTDDLVMLHHFEEGTYCDTDGVANCLTNDTPNTTYDEVNHGSLENFNALTTYDNGVDGWITTNKKPELRWTGGRFASAGAFDGGGDRVYQAYDADFNFGTSSFTISSWFKHNTIANSSDYLLSRYDDDQGYKVWMDSSGDMCFGIDDDATWGPDDSACTTGIDYDDNQWHHLTAYKDGTSAIYLYIDSVLVASDVSLTATGTLTSNSATMNIGSDVGVGSEAPNASYYINTWEGEIDDMKVYGYGRSADEIRLDYNAGFAARFGGKVGRAPSSTQCSLDPAACMDYGLVGHWNMDEAGGDTLYDQSDNGNDGTLGSSVGADTSDPKWTSGGGDPLSASGRERASSGALQFDGKNDYINCGNDPSLDITDAITIEAWVKPAEDANNLYFAGKDDAVNRIWLLVASGGVKFEFIIWGENVGIKRTYANKNFVPNIWHHVVGIYNGTIQKIYVNGIQQTDTNSYSDTIKSSIGTNVEIGKSFGANYFNGSIDGVKIYNRALSAEEVRYHYNRGGPVAHWKFDEGTGQKAYDSAGNADADFPAADANQPSWSR